MQDESDLSAGSEVGNINLEIVGNQVLFPRLEYFIKAARLSNSDCFYIHIFKPLALLASVLSQISNGQSSHTSIVCPSVVTLIT
jgi:hypothetical protein